MGPDNNGRPAESRRTNDQLSRRDWLKGIASTTAVAATGVGSLTVASGTAAAHTTSSYTIRDGTAEETTVYVLDGPEDGPTVMVVGGVHGDEEAGYESARKIKEWHIHRGKLVVLPNACWPAIRNDSRTYYDGDLNRHFPAGETPESSLARAIWDVVTSENIDFLWDLHSSSGIYDNGNGSGVGQGVFSTQAGDAQRHRYHLQSYLNDNFVNDPDYEFTGATSSDGSKDMLKHKVGADLDTPAIIFETYRGIADARQRMFNQTAVQEFLQDEGILKDKVRYNGLGHAKNTSEDANGKNSGLKFGIENRSGLTTKITDVGILPVTAAADKLEDHSMDEGKWVSELFVDADVQNGVTDIGGGVSLPTTIDCDSDGHSDSPDTEATMSSWSNSTFYLYEFLLNGSPKEMGHEEVEIRLRYDMSDETRGVSTFVVSGGHGLEYNGNGRAVNTPADGNNDSSGIFFNVTNNTHSSDLTINEITIDPQNSNVDTLKDHTYAEGKWDSEVFIAADVQNGVCDVGGGVSLPASIDLDSDGHSDSPDTEAVLSQGSKAGVHLYQFKSGGSPHDMVGEDVNISIAYTLGDGSTGTSSFTVSL